MALLVKYCDVCGKRIPKQDFVEGQAVEWKGKTYCSEHVPAAAMGLAKARRSTAELPPSPGKPQNRKAPPSQGGSKPPRHSRGPRMTRPPSESPQRPLRITDRDVQRLGDRRLLPPGKGPLAAAESGLRADAQEDEDVPDFSGAEAILPPPIPREGGSPTWRGGQHRSNGNASPGLPPPRKPSTRPLAGPEAARPYRPAKPSPPTNRSRGLLEAAEETDTRPRTDRKPGGKSRRPTPRPDRLRNDASNGASQKYVVLKARADGQGYSLSDTEAPDDCDPDLDSLDELRAGGKRTGWQRVREFMTTVKGIVLVAGAGLALIVILVLNFSSESATEGGSPSPATARSTTDATSGGSTETGGGPEVAPVVVTREEAHRNQWLISLREHIEMYADLQLEVPHEGEAIPVDLLKRLEQGFLEMLNLGSEIPTALVPEERDRYQQTFQDWGRTASRPYLTRLETHIEEKLAECDFKKAQELLDRARAGTANVLPEHFVREDHPVEVVEAALDDLSERILAAEARFQELDQREQAMMPPLLRLIRELEALDDSWESTILALRQLFEFMRTHFLIHLEPDLLPAREYNTAHARYAERGFEVLEDLYNRVTMRGARERDAQQFLLLSREYLGVVDAHSPPTEEAIREVRAWYLRILREEDPLRGYDGRLARALSIGDIELALQAHLVLDRLSAIHELPAEAEVRVESLRARSKNDITQIMRMGMLMMDGIPQSRKRAMAYLYIWRFDPQNDPDAQYVLQWLYDNGGPITLADFPHIHQVAEDLIFNIRAGSHESAAFWQVFYDTVIRIDELESTSHGADDPGVRQAQAFFRDFCVRETISRVLEGVPPFRRMAREQIDHCRALLEVLPEDNASDQETRRILAWYLAKLEAAMPYLEER